MIGGGIELVADATGVIVLVGGVEVWRAYYYAPHRYTWTGGGGIPPDRLTTPRSRVLNVARYVAAGWRAHKPRVLPAESYPSGGDVARAWVKHWREWREANS